MNLLVCLFSASDTIRSHRFQNLVHFSFVTINYTLHCLNNNMVLHHQQRHSSKKLRKKCEETCEKCSLLRNEFFRLRARLAKQPLLI